MSGSAADLKIAARLLGGNYTVTLQRDLLAARDLEI